MASTKPHNGREKTTTTPRRRRVAASPARKTTTTTGGLKVAKRTNAPKDRVRKHTLLPKPSRHNMRLRSTIPKFRIDELPAELRNKIYELTLPDEKTRSLTDLTLPPLLSLHSSIRSEALPFFFFNNNFGITVNVLWSLFQETFEEQKTYPRMFGETFNCYLEENPGRLSQLPPDRIRLSNVNITLLDHERYRYKNLSVIEEKGYKVISIHLRMKGNNVFPTMSIGYEDKDEENGISQLTRDVINEIEVEVFCLPQCEYFTLQTVLQVIDRCCGVQSEQPEPHAASPEPEEDWESESNWSADKHFQD